MCAWDLKKHKVLASKKYKHEDQTVIVELYSYDKADPKIALRGEIEKKDGSKVITPVKGMTPELALKVGIGMKKMAKAYLDPAEDN
jgi:hypothetical protein